ncbi:uncharacterized protein LOC131928767 isoform X2 [Physella acuta]|nr:uncharacterized protein LOC131928767 isoform X2 [Physella acuta]
MDVDEDDFSTSIDMFEDFEDDKNLNLMDVVDSTCEELPINESTQILLKDKNEKASASPEDNSLKKDSIETSIYNYSDNFQKSQVKPSEIVKNNIRRTVEHDDGYVDQSGNSHSFEGLPSKRHKPYESESYGTISTIDTTIVFRGDVCPGKGQSQSKVLESAQQDNVLPVSTMPSTTSNSQHSRWTQQSASSSPESNLNLESPQSSHDIKSPYTCPFCDIPKPDFVSLEHHIATSHPYASDQQRLAADSLHNFLPEETPYPFVCPFCDICFDDVVTLEIHLAELHNDEINNKENLIACPLCEAMYASEEDMKVHIKSHEHDRTFYGVSVSAAVSNTGAGSMSGACPVCNQVMMDPDLLTSHVESHFNPQHSPEPWMIANHSKQKEVIPASLQRKLSSDKESVTNKASPQVKDNHHGTLMNGNISNPHQQRASTLAQCNKETRANLNRKETNIPSNIADKQSTSVDSIKPSATDNSSKPSAGASTIKSSSSVDSYRPSTNPSRIKQTTVVDNFKSSTSGGGFKVSNGINGFKPSGGSESVGYRRQYEQNLEKDVAAGKLSVADYHMRLAKLSQTDMRGMDDGSTRVQGLIQKIAALYQNQARGGQNVFLCSPTDHYSSSYGDRGWGCGYRNFQMILSCLSRIPMYAGKIFTDGQIVIPSTPKIQQMIELAWQKGFDQEGSRQFNGKLTNTSKWIGATEIMATLSYLGVKCQLADFHAPSAPNGTHPLLFEWVNDYFTKNLHQPKVPLYLQHQGHSRTIIGIENERGITKLLLFDPGTPNKQMAELAKNNYLMWKDMKVFRKTLLGFQAKQYQVIAVLGLLNETEYEESKLLKSEIVS